MGMSMYMCKDCLKKQGAKNVGILWISCRCQVCGTVRQCKEVF